MKMVVPYESIHHDINRTNIFVGIVASTHQSYLVQPNMSVVLHHPYMEIRMEKLIMKTIALFENLRIKSHKRNHIGVVSSMLWKAYVLTNHSFPAVSLHHVQYWLRDVENDTTIPR